MGTSGMIKKTITTTIEAEWEIAGPLPTIAEMTQIIRECSSEGFDKSLTLEIIPAGINGAGKTDKAKVKMKTYVNNDDTIARPKVYRGAVTS